MRDDLWDDSRDLLEVVIGRTRNVFIAVPQREERGSLGVPFSPRGLESDPRPPPLAAHWGSSGSGGRGAPGGSVFFPLGVTMPTGVPSFHGNASCSTSIGDALRCGIWSKSQGQPCLPIVDLTAGTARLTVEASLHRARAAPSSSRHSPPELEAELNARQWMQGVV